MKQWKYLLLLHMIQKVYMKDTILITGGAGYIGSHTAHLMAQKGYRVIILDDLYYGHPFVHDWATFIKGNCGDEIVLDQIFTQYKIDAVIHFAGFIAVGESVKKPIMYYDNNVVKTLVLFKKMVQYGVEKVIFSSSAAVYGMPERLPLVEDHPKNPVNAYGNTKLIIEFLLSDFSRAYGLKFVALRYFNACGAEPQFGLGEYHEPETHLIPLAIRAALSGKEFSIFGNDYETADKTCIRDYLHVTDLADAHVRALEYLGFGGKSDCFNLGTGKGHSVKEVLTMVEKVCERKLNIKICARREGDPSILVADPSKAEKILGWKAVHSDLDKIIHDAFIFEQPLYIKRLASEGRFDSLKE